MTRQAAATDQPRYAGRTHNEADPLRTVGYGQATPVLDWLIVSLQYVVKLG